MSNDDASDQNPNSMEDTETQLSSIKLTEHDVSVSHTNERASISIENGSTIDRESTEEDFHVESRSSSSTSFESVAEDDVRDGGAANNSENGSMVEGNLVRESTEEVADVEVYCDFPPVSTVAAEEFKDGFVRCRNNSEIENRAMDMEDGKLGLASREEEVAEVEVCCETSDEEEVRDGVGRSWNNLEINIDVPSSPSSSGYARDGIVCSRNNSEIENRAMEHRKSVQSTEEEVAEVEDCCETSLEDEVKDVVVRSRNNSEIEIDVPSSPSSSGYVGGMGSSSGASGNDEIGEDDEISEIGEIRNGDAADKNAGSQDSWVAGKRHVDEDDASMSWRKRKKHYIILSNSGKPIYSRYGDEHKLAGFSATLQAIISFVENGGDRVNLIRAGKHQVVFVVKGPIYLVCISCTEEPYESLRGQLELIYGQMLLILTKSVNRCFQKNPKFDMTPLLGGTDVVFSSLIHSFGWNLAAFLHAYTCLPLAYVTRQAAGAILQDVADSGVLFAILMCKHKVISLVGAQKACLHPDDMLLLANFVMASESFRTSESFSPICLPRYNPMAFLYAYIHYLDVDTYLVLLTTRSDAFHHLRECRIGIEKVLLKSYVLSDIQRSMLDGGMRVEDLPVDTLPRSGSSSPHLGQHGPLSDSSDRFREAYGGIGGPAGLWHFIYRSIYLDQYVSSEFSSPINSPRQQKRLYRAYERLYSSMHDKGTGSHKTQFRRDENYVLLCWVTQDFELYAAFDPLADKALAIKTCNRVCQWVKDVENEIFLLGASPFSW